MLLNTLAFLILLQKFIIMKVKNYLKMIFILGITGFYKGFKFNCVKSFPKGIFFLFYEIIKKQIPKEPSRY